MSLPELRFRNLKDTGDVRGSSFETGTDWIAFLGKVDDAHITTLLPGCVRGNHYHVRRREVIVVLSSDEWQLAWDQGADTAVTLKQFGGGGAVVVEVDPLASHAVSNSGKAPLWIIGLSNGAWDIDEPDAFPRKVFP
jgi:dTDP-4-dehydrorhamnose 3,5-epimerase-like enzyme